MGWSSLSTVEGSLGATVFGLLTPVLLVIAAVTLGSRAIAGDEEAQELEWLRFGSAFHYAMDPDPLLHGFGLGRTALLAVPVVLAALGALAFTRRDVGV